MISLLPTYPVRMLHPFGRNFSPPPSHAHSSQVFFFQFVTHMQKSGEVKQEKHIKNYLAVSLKILLGPALAEIVKHSVLAPSHPCDPSALGRMVPVGLELGHQAFVDLQRMILTGCFLGATVCFRTSWVKLLAPSGRPLPCNSANVIPGRDETMSFWAENEAEKLIQTFCSSDRDCFLHRLCVWSSLTSISIFLSPRRPWNCSFPSDVPPGRIRDMCEAFDLQLCQCYIGASSQSLLNMKSRLLVLRSLKKLVPRVQMIDVSFHDSATIS